MSIETALPSLALPVPAEGRVDVARLTPARRQQAAIIAASVQAHDGNAVAAFGAGPQRKLSGLLDRLLSEARADETGPAGELLTELATEIKAMELQAVTQEAEGKRSLLARLPLVGTHYSALRRFRAMQMTVLGHLTAIERRAEAHIGKLKASHAGLERLLDATEETLREVEAWVAGGQQALLGLRAGLRTEWDAPAGVHDPGTLAKLQDMGERNDAFETRLVRMHAAFTRGALSIPQVRAAQQAGRIAMQDTLDVVLSGLPDLKVAIERVAALEQISRSSESEIGSVSQAADKLLAAIARGHAIERESRLTRDWAVQQLGEVRQGVMEGLRTAADGVRLS